MIWRAVLSPMASRTYALDPRPVTIERLELDAVTEGAADFTVTCGKGTYIRSLARDIALAAGTVGHVSRLRRLSVGPFDAGCDFTGFFERLGASAAAEHLKPVTSALDDIRRFLLRRKRQQTSVTDRPALGPSAQARFAAVATSEVRCCAAGSVPVALVTVRSGRAAAVACVQSCPWPPDRRIWMKPKEVSMSITRNYCRAGQGIRQVGE